jgi:hypothetical protein
LKLLGSTPGEGQDVNRKENIFLPAVIAQLDRFPIVAEQREVWGSVADLKGEFGNLVFFLGPCGDRGECRRESKQKSGGKKTLHGELLVGKSGLGRRDDNWKKAWSLTKKYGGPVIPSLPAASRRSEKSLFTTDKKE